MLQAYQNHISFFNVVQWECKMDIGMWSKLKN